MTRPLNHTLPLFGDAEVNQVGLIRDRTVCARAYTYPGLPLDCFLPWIDAVRPRLVQLHSDVIPEGDLSRRYKVLRKGDNATFGSPTRNSTGRLQYPSILPQAQLFR